MTARFLVPVSAILLHASFAQGASYSTDFNNYSPGNLDGQYGWTVSATGDYDPGAIVPTGSFWGARSASIGWSTGLSQQNVYVSHETNTPLYGDVPTVFAVMFQIYDSDSFNGGDPAAAVRDTFGFRLENAAGNNILSIHFTPFSQSDNPENDTAYHTFSWSTGDGPTVPVLVGTGAVEWQSYILSISFSAAGGGDAAFSASIGTATFNGVIPGGEAESIGRFGAFWNTSDAAAPGSNQMLFDNVSLVPEPSVVPLGAVGCLPLLRRRRLALA